MESPSSDLELHIFPYAQGLFVIFHPVSKVFFRASRGTAEVLRRAARGQSVDEIARSISAPRSAVRGVVEGCETQIQRRLDHFSQSFSKPDPQESKICGKLSFHVSNDCNMRCRYCYAAGGNYGLDRDKMSVSVSLRILDRFYDSFDAINEIMFFGGEPLLNFPAIEAVCRSLAERSRRDPTKRMPQLGMVTNLSAIPVGLPGLIREYGMSVTVSLDGPPEVHDRNRVFMSGRGTYAVVSRNIKKLKELTGEPGMIEATYTRQHMEEGITSQDLLDYFAREFGVLQAEIADVSVAPDHPARVPGRHVRQLVDEQDAAMESMLEALADGQQVPGISELFCTLSLLLADPRPFDVHCNAGIHQYAVSTKGDLYPCHMFVGEKDLLMGNVFEQGVFEGARMKEVRWQLLKAAKSQGRCRTCWARNLCMGCIARCWHEQGDIHFARRANCTRIRSSYERLLGRLAQISESPQCWNNLLAGLQAGSSRQRQGGEVPC